MGRGTTAPLPPTNDRFPTDERRVRFPPKAEEMRTFRRTNRHLHVAFVAAPPSRTDAHVHQPLLRWHSGADSASTPRREVRSRVCQSASMGLPDCVFPIYCE